MYDLAINNRSGKYFAHHIQDVQASTVDSSYALPRKTNNKIRIIRFYNKGEIFFVKTSTLEVCVNDVGNIWMMVKPD